MTLKLYYHPLSSFCQKVLIALYENGTACEKIIGSAVSRASQTLRHLRWFEVVRTSGHIVDGQIQHYQVTLKVGFTMEGAA